MNTRAYFKRLVPTGLVMLMLLASTAVPAADASAGTQNSIEALTVSTAAGGKVVVRVTLKQVPSSPPAGISLNNPARVYFDFLDTANALGKNAQEVNEGDLRSLNIVQAGNRTRLVLNLNKAAAYDTQIDGRNLLITLQGEPAAIAGAGVTSRFAEARPGDQKHSVRDIEFRRGKDGEGKVLVDLSDTSTGIDIRQQGKSVIVDFIKTSLPRNLERRLDVTDFATPIQIIDTSTQGENVRMVIEPKGLWEHSAYQTDNKFILEVKPVVEDTSKLTPGGRGVYTGEKLSLNFQNVEVRAVLQVIADFTGLNIITSDTVSGNLTLRLKDVPWDQALDIILQAKGLDMRKTGNVVLIAPRDEIATKEKLDLESRQQISDLEPTRTESFQLNYQKADAVKPLLSDPAQKILSKRGSVVVDARTNTLFIKDTPTQLEEVRKLIRKIDVPVRQVMIEARIVEANDNFSKSIGTRLGYHDTTGRGFNLPANNLRASVGGSLNDTGFHTGQTTTSPAFPSDTLSVNLPSSGAGGNPAGVFSILLFNQASTKFLNLELSALEADSKGKIISSPRVVTADQVEALIESGTEIPYQQATSSGATSVSFKKATLSLKVKPQITPDDNIIMNLNVNKDSPGATTAAGPAINTKQITTQVLVENGGTVVIGGIYEQTQQTNVSKVPVLGDLPYVGFLFKNTNRTDNKTELLIFVTPRVVKESLNIR